jgi:hypothetical protein
MSVMAHVAPDKDARLDGVRKTNYVKPLIASLALAQCSSRQVRVDDS